MKRAWLLPMRRQPFLPRRARHCVAFALSAWLFLPTGGINDCKRTPPHLLNDKGPRRASLASSAGLGCRLGCGTQSLTLLWPVPRSRSDGAPDQRANSLEYRSHNSFEPCLMA